MPKWIQRNSIEDSTGSANEDKNIWNVTHSETIRHIWRVFLKIKIRWKNRLNISFDEEFNALPDYAILIEKIDLENVGKKTKQTWNVTNSQRIPHIWPGFFKIKIHWKNRLNRSFNEEFNALRETPILTEKIDWGNCEKKEEKDRMLHTQRQFLIHDEFFPRWKSIAKRHSLHHSIENSMI